MSNQGKYLSATASLTETREASSFTQWELRAQAGYSVACLQSQYLGGWRKED